MLRNLVPKYLAIFLKKLGTFWKLFVITYLWWSRIFALDNSRLETSRKLFDAQEKQPQTNLNILDRSLKTQTPVFLKTSLKFSIIRLCLSAFKSIIYLCLKIFSFQLNQIFVLVFQYVYLYSNCCCTVYCWASRVQNQGQTAQSIL